jgi:hypothetical protein
MSMSECYKADAKLSVLSESDKQIVIKSFSETLAKLGIPQEKIQESITILENKLNENTWEESDEE